MKTLLILSCALALSLVGCGSSSSSSETASSGEQAGGEEHHGEGHHGEGGGHHGAMSPAVTSLHDVLAPTWHSEPGATRAALACTNAAQLEERSRAVAAEPAPEGRTAEAWTALTTTLTERATALVTECSASGPAAEERLSSFHDAFHAIMERAPRAPSIRCRGSLRRRPDRAGSAGSSCRTRASDR